MSAAQQSSHSPGSFYLPVILRDFLCFMTVSLWSQDKCRSSRDCIYIQDREQREGMITTTYILVIRKAKSFSASPVVLSHCQQVSQWPLAAEREVEKKSFYFPAFIVRVAKKKSVGNGCCLNQLTCPSLGWTV